MRPCVKCGSTERSKRGDCVPCAKLFQKNWYQRNKARVAAYKKTWLSEHPDRSDDFDLHARVRRYGLTVGQYRDMIERQHGLCGICAKPLDRIDIDHDHTTGRVRGLLCHACNIGVGAFQDDPVILMRAIQYLQVATSVEGVEVVCTTT